MRNPVSKFFVKMRSMGLDIGDRRIGVALSDPGGLLASPLTIIERTNLEDDVAAIVTIVVREKVGWIVAGLPKRLDGTVGEQARKVQGFVGALSEKVMVPVEWRDERLTTAAAQSLIHAARTNRTKRARQKFGHKVRDDAAAAAIILQDFLDEE